MNFARAFLPLSTSLLLVAGLSACSLTESPKPAAKSSTGATAPKTTPKATASAPAAPAETTTGTSAAGPAPAWAKPVTTPGTLLTTAKGSNFRVDIYQIGTVPSTKQGFFADPETHQPIISVGTPVVYMNYVVTNTSSAPIELSNLLVQVQPTYADWKFMTGMDSITDFTLDASMKINETATSPKSDPDMKIYTFAPGESFSYGGNFKYQANSPITFSIKRVPVDADGKLVSAKTELFEVKSTIK